MSEKKYYCFCSSNCKYETMTKEQILAAITQAANGSAVIDPDAGVITKVKETNGGANVTFWVGTQVQYNALQTIDRNCLYIITDDTTTDELKKAIEDLKVANENAVAAAANVQAIDISNRILLSYVDNGDGNVVTVPEKQYVYIPALQMVFFRAVVDLEKGAAMSIRLNHLAADGGAAVYKPTHLAVAAVQRKGSIVKYMLKGDQPILDILAESELNTDGSIKYSFFVNGWYFCDGE